MKTFQVFCSPSVVHLWCSFVWSCQQSNRPCHLLFTELMSVPFCFKIIWFKREGSCFKDFEARTELALNAEHYTALHWTFFCFCRIVFSWTWNLPKKLYAFHSSVVLMISNTSRDCQYSANFRSWNDVIVFCLAHIKKCCTKRRWVHDERMEWCILELVVHLNTKIT